MPVDVRSVSLVVIATLLSLYALHWARQIVIPILMGLMVSYALTPLVNALQRRRVPRAIGASTLLALILGGTAWGVFALSDQTEAWVESLPAVTQKVRELSHRMVGKASAMQKVQQAATEIVAATEPGAAASAPAGSTAVVVHRPTPTAAPVASRIDIRGYLVTGTLGLFAFLGQVAVVFLLALFLLISGNSFRRKMVKLAGPTLRQKRVTVETLDEITEQIQRYLLIQIALSFIVGVATWLAFAALGLNQAAVWGVVAAVTNLVPYVGSLLVGVGAAVVALVQFGTPEMALLVGGSSLAIHAVVGNLLTPWWTGKTSKMSPVAVFVAILLFGWLWGVAGLFLGVPILLAVKSVCDRLDDLKPIGELLGA